MDQKQPKPKRQPPVHLPLPFGDAVSGLLRVKPLPKKPKKKDQWSNPDADKDEPKS